MVSIAFVVIYTFISHTSCLTASLCFVLQSQLFSLKGSGFNECLVYCSIPEDLNMAIVHSLQESSLSSVYFFCLF